MDIIEKERKNLLNSNAVLVLGILSLVFCWCYGFIGLVLGIIAVVLSNSGRKLYMASPDEYTESSYKNLNAGRICGIVGICIASLIILFFVLVLCGVFALALAGITHGLYNLK